jgi:hypothetical protein
MNPLLKILTISGILFLLIYPVSAIDYTSWKEVTVNEAPMNSSSNTIYSMRIPPGNSVLLKDTIIGPITDVFNKNNPGSRITIVIRDNQAGKQFDTGASRQYLDKFMLGAKISQVYGSEPQVLSNGGVMAYGASGDKVLGIYIMSTDRKVIIVTGYYKSIQDAKNGVETLGMLAGSIQV